MRKMLLGFGVVGILNLVRVYVLFLRLYGFKVVVFWGRIKEDVVKVVVEFNIFFYFSNVDEVNNYFYCIV